MAGRTRRVLLGILGVVMVAIGGWLLTGRPVRYGPLASAESRPDSWPSAAYRVEQVTLLTERERRLDCLLRTPSTAGAPRPPAEPAAGATRIAGAAGVAPPALLVAGGRRTGRRAVLYLDTSYTGVALSCDYPWAELARLRGVRFVLRLPQLRAEILATPEALAAAATYLVQRAGADAPLVALGASLGVPPVAAWAARDSRPRAVALLYGGGQLWRVVAANLEEDVPSPWLRLVVARALGAALRPIEPVRTVGAIAPRPLLVIASADDTWIPLESVEALVAAAGEPKRLIWFRGVHMRTGDDALLRALADSTLTWLSAVLPARGGRRP